MKKIEATIQRTKLGAVKEALVAAGVQGMTVSEVNGIGEQSRTMTYRGTSHTVDSIAKVKVETIVADREAERIVDTIFQSAHTGELGDGSIVVSEIQSVTRIRTGETEDSDEEFIRHEVLTRPRFTEQKSANLPAYQHSN
jgi:nitrogen regulatory protein P-II 1